MTLYYLSAPMPINKVKLRSSHIQPTLFFYCLQLVHLEIKACIEAITNLIRIINGVSY